MYSAAVSIRPAPSAPAPATRQEANMPWSARSRAAYPSCAARSTFRRYGAPSTATFTSLASSRSALRRYARTGGQPTARALQHVTSVSKSGPWASCRVSSCRPHAERNKEKGRERERETLGMAACRGRRGRACDRRRARRRSPGARG
uniref:Uncharacterized protein n=1 Tax=Zea mays TaxID=4577 RepID=C4IY55_MAIZE|nr:unknown [Zea mays]